MNKMVYILFPILMDSIIELTARFLQLDSISSGHCFFSIRKLVFSDIIFPILGCIISFCIRISIDMMELSDFIKKKRLIKQLGVQFFFSFVRNLASSNSLLEFMDILLLDICVVIYILKNYVRSMVSFIYSGINSLDLFYNLFIYLPSSKQLILCVFIIPCRQKP